MGLHMRLHDELLEPLLAGLPKGDQREVLLAIRRTRDEQLRRKIEPPRRRRRDEDGVLRMPERFS
jgi:hypothetical protein